MLRLFDPDLAARVERTFGIHISRSVSALAAPLFAAAAVGQRALATIPVGLRALVVALARVEPGSWAAGQTVATLEAATESRVLLTTCGGHEQWRPSAETILTPEHALTVVATRAGLTQVLARTQAPGDRWSDGPGV